MIISDLRTAIVDAIAAALPSLREVKPHGGRFSLDELKAAAARSPSVRVACLGVAEVVPGATAVTATTSWGAFVVCGDRPQLPRDGLALDLVAALLTVVPLADWGLADRVDSARAVRADNLFSRDLDRHGVALWAVTWRHAVDLLPADLSGLDDFLHAHVAYDYPADGEADFADEIMLPGPDTGEQEAGD